MPCEDVDPEYDNYDPNDPTADLEIDDLGKSILRAFKEASTAQPIVVEETEDVRVLAFPMTPNEFQVFLERMGAPPFDSIAGTHCESCENCEQFQQDGHYRIVEPEDCECRTCHGT